MPIRDRIASFEAAQDEIRRLDSSNLGWGDAAMYQQYQRRNSFGLDPSTKIYRIFQERYYQDDVQNRCLTLPRADANVWSSTLENPLSAVTQIDDVTGQPIDLGSVVRHFHALCWTSRSQVTREDWENFSHGKPTVRVETTIGKLLDRVMNHSDSAYMHRSWMIDADYQSHGVIRSMQTEDELLARLDSTGARLAMTVATVETGYSDEEEIRFLFDHGISPVIAHSVAPNLIHLPFDWDGFADSVVRHP